MASKDKQIDAGRSTGERTLRERMRERYAAGDVKAARAAAWELMHDASASEADRAEAQRLREATEVDRRAWAIAALAVAIAAAVTIFFLL
jgi:hypothetical protein